MHHFSRYRIAVVCLPCDFLSPIFRVIINKAVGWTWTVVFFNKYYHLLSVLLHTGKKISREDNTFECVVYNWTETAPSWTSNSPFRANVTMKSVLCLALVVAIAMIYSCDAEDLSVSYYYIFQWKSLCLIYYSSMT